MIYLEATLQVVPGKMREFMDVFEKEFLPENNKLGLFIKACGIEFEEGDTVDLDDVIGQVANATIIVSLKKSDNTEFNKVESVRPLKKKKRTEPEPAAQPKSKDKDEEDIFADE